MRDLFIAQHWGGKKDLFRKLSLRISKGASNLKGEFSGLKRDLLDLQKVLEEFTDLNKELDFDGLAQNALMFFIMSISSGLANIVVADPPITSSISLITLLSMLITFTFGLGYTAKITYNGFELLRSAKNPTKKR